MGIPRITRPPKSTAYDVENTKLYDKVAMGCKLAIYKGNNDESNVKSFDDLLGQYYTVLLDENTKIKSESLGIKYKNRVHCVLSQIIYNFFQFTRHVSIDHRSSSVASVRYNVPTLSYNRSFPQENIYGSFN